MRLLARLRTRDGGYAPQQTPVPTPQRPQTCQHDARWRARHYQRDALISELWEDEKRHLLALPEYDYEVFRYEAFAAFTPREHVRAGTPMDKQGFITIDTVRYGLAPLAGVPAKSADFVGWRRRIV